MKYKYLKKYKGSSGKWVYVYPDGYYDKYDKRGNIISRHITGSHYKNVAKNASENFNRASYSKKNTNTDIAYLNTLNSNNRSVQRLKADQKKKQQTLSNVQKQASSNRFSSMKNYREKSIAGKLSKIKHKVQLYVAKYNLSKKKQAYAATNRKIANKRKMNKILGKFGISVK